MAGIAHEMDVIRKIVEKYLEGEQIQDQVMQAFGEKWELFRVLPASKSGKYHHPSENNVPYGLMNHTLRVLWFADKLYIEERGKREKQPLIRNQLMAAAFIHDMGKLWDYHSHAKNAADFAEYLGMTPYCQDMTRYHMHYWFPCKVDELDGELQIYCRILAYADYLASLPDLEIKECWTFEQWMVVYKR
jgi:hypothetical protein